MVLSQSKYGIVEQMKNKKRKKMVRFMAPYILLFVSCVLSGAEASDKSGIPEFLPGRRAGTVQTGLITEASGIVASRKNPPVLWVHNDSGHAADVYAINPEGKLLATCRIKGARCRDWEDIAIGPGPDPQHDLLYIGDIGDNGSRYPFITVYRLPEPKVDPNGASVEMTTGPAEAIELVYPDGPKDAETLLVDPLSRDIYIIAKRELLCRVYRAAYPQSTTRRNTLKLVTRLPWGLAVAGDVSPDGRLVMVRGVVGASIWVRPKGKPLWRAFKTTPVPLKLIPEPQGEGICFDADGRGHFTISEMEHPPIYYFPARSPVPPSQKVPK
jgi:hypothetical protein